MNVAVCPSKLAGLRRPEPELACQHMSRRSRRRGASQPGGGSWLARATIIMLVLCLLGAAVFYASVRSYLHSEGFRRLLSQKASAALKVTGDFTPFLWDGLAVEAETFHGSGQGIISALRVDGLHTEIGLGGLRRGVWEIRGARMGRVMVLLDHAKADSRHVSQPAIKPGIDFDEASEKPSGWLPREVELQGLEIGQLDVKALLQEGSVTASGMRVDVKPDGRKKSFRAEISGGTVSLPFELIPHVRLDQARLRYQDGAAFLTHLSAAAWKDCQIEAAGEWNRETQLFSVEGGASGVRCEDILSETWAKRLSGELTTDFTTNNHSGKPVAQGHLVLQNGILTALPVLDILAAYADTRRFRVLTLSEAHANWRWERDLLELTNIVIASEGLARLEGRLTIRGQNLDGQLRLGLLPGTLATIPGAETDVFILGERGLLWAPFHLTGTLEKPREDLSDRLVAAAGLRILETLPESGEKVIKFTKSVLSKPTVERGVEKGVEIIEKSGLNVRDVTSIFDSLLGNSGSEEPKPEPEATEEKKPR